MTKIDFDDIVEEKQGENAPEMLVRKAVIALAANLKSQESFYLIKITEEEKEKAEDVKDSFSYVTKKAMKHLEGVFLKRKFYSHNLCTISKKPKSVFFFRESVVPRQCSMSQKRDILNLLNRSC